MSESHAVLEDIIELGGSLNLAFKKFNSTEYYTRPEMIKIITRLSDTIDLSDPDTVKALEEVANRRIQLLTIRTKIVGAILGGLVRESPINSGYVKSIERRIDELIGAHALNGLIGELM